jgi:DNA-binding transcriptional LysR family regulator
MKLRHVEVVHFVLKTGSVSAAAAMLHVSQPTVTKVLAHAEQQLGFQLFARTGGRLRATPEAEALRPRLARLYEELISLDTLAEQLRQGEVGELKVGAVPALGMSVLPEVVRRFRESHPGAGIHFHVMPFDRTAAAVLDGELDLALTLEPPEATGLYAERLGTIELLALLPSTLATHANPVSPGRLSLSELIRHPFIQLPETDPLTTLLRAACAQADGALHAHTEVQAGYMALPLVASGLGVAVVDAYTAAGINDSRTSFFALEPPVRVGVHAISAVDRPRPVLSTHFLDLCRQGLSCAPIMAPGSGA